MGDVYMGEFGWALCCRSICVIGQCVSLRCMSAVTKALGWMVVGDRDVGGSPRFLPHCCRVVAGGLALFGL